MSIVSQNEEDFQRSAKSVSIFLRTFQIAKLLRTVRAMKQKGVSALDSFRCILTSVFADRSIYRLFLSGCFREAFSKNTYYRFLNSARTNWANFTARLSAAIINEKLRHLTNDGRADAFIVDDTLYERAGCKKTELASRLFDHNEHRYRKGFRLLTLGWSDGVSFVPILSRLMASGKDENLLGMSAKVDQRTIGGKIRAQARRKMTDVMVELLSDAIHAGHRAKYVLFDSWFASPAQVRAVKNVGKDEGISLDVTAMVKRSSKVQYRFEGKMRDIKSIFGLSHKRRGRSRYLLSVDVEIIGGKEEEPIPARIVCARNRANRKEWVAILCTDMGKSPEDIIAIYGKRWDIEVFFKTCKSLLRLGKECHSLSYDALTAHVAIVFTRYMMLALAKRENEDSRSLGGLFYMMADELRDKTFHESMQMLFCALLASAAETLQLHEEKMQEMLTGFWARLPFPMQRCLSCSLESCV